MESIDALATAVQKYDGGMVLVSHDMRLISQVANEIWICDEKTVTKYKGDIHNFKMDMRVKMDLDDGSKKALKGDASVNRKATAKKEKVKPKSSGISVVTKKSMASAPSKPVSIASPPKPIAVPVPPKLVSTVPPTKPALATPVSKTASPSSSAPQSNWRSRNASSPATNISINGSTKSSFKSAESLKIPTEVVDCWDDSDDEEEKKTPQALSSGTKVFGGSRAYVPPHLRNRS
mmetsp:Transcript_35959/g.83926  ORF Transcript_35959/g.83926 Transcript_35959/m.83926 type:complete len:234 (-) Transcript_35959:158-859(-)